MLRCAGCVILPPQVNLARPSDFVTTCLKTKRHLLVHQLCDAASIIKRADHRRSVHHLPGLKLSRKANSDVLCMEISPVGTADEAGHRTVVVALDTEVESLRALDWVQDNFHKPGDIVHMVHVCKCMSSPLEVFHGVPGTSLHVADPAPHNESTELASAREFFMGRVKDKLDKAGIQWDLHLFADTVNSDATDIAIIIQKTAEKVRPALVVLAHHDKPKQGYFAPGSVAKVCESLPLPLCIIP